MKRLGSLLAAAALIVVMVPLSASGGYPGSPTPIDRALSGAEYTRTAAWTPDGARLLYTVRVNPNLTEYRAVDPTGANDVLVSTIAGAGQLRGYWMSPTGDTIVYLRDVDGDGFEDHIAARMDGSGAVKLLDTVTTQEILYDRAGVEYEPDGRHVIVQADTRVDDRWELWRIPIGGGTPVLLSHTPSGFTDVAPDFAISPDGQRLVYLAYFSTAPVQRLFSVPVTGGTPRLLSGDYLVRDFAIAPNSARVVFTADNGNARELFSAKIAGGGLTNPSGSLASGDEVVDFTISPNGKQVAYRLDPGFGPYLYAAPVTAATDPVLLHDVGADDLGDDYLFTPDSKRILFRATLDGDAAIELWSVRPNGAGLKRINDNVTRGEVTSFGLTPDGSTVVFAGDMTQYRRIELYAANSTGGNLRTLATPVTVNPSNDLPITFDIGYDGSEVVYRSVTDDSPRKYRLFSVAVGGGESTDLIGDFSDEEVEVWWRLNPAKRLVAFTLRTDDNPAHDIFSVETRLPKCRGKVATIIGTDGKDQLTGTSGADVIVGLGGNDVIRGLEGNDFICGGPGNDKIYGGPGKDKINGDAGDDTIRGEADDDKLAGNAGFDTIIGQGGNDRMVGGGKADTCNGGPGTDTAKGCETVTGVP